MFAGSFKRRALLFILVVNYISFVPSCLVYMEETLSLVLAICLIVILISQGYSLFLRSVRTQVLLAITKFKWLYCYIFLSLYLFCVVHGLNSKEVSFLSGYRDAGVFAICWKFVCTAVFGKPVVALNRLGFFIRSVEAFSTCPATFRNIRVSLSMKSLLNITYILLFI